MDALNILTALTASIITCIFWIIRLHQVEKLKEDWKQLAIKAVQASIDLMTLLKKDVEVLNVKPLIVCKDCIHYDAKTHWCFTKCINIGPDGYCSDALKKED